MSPLADLLIALRFLSRLPVPTVAREEQLGPAAFAGAAAMVPVAGAIIGGLPVLGLLAATAVGLPPLLAAPVAIAGLVAVTGALHEDALADCADGFGGGRTRLRKLEIMRDSRIGTFGACAVAMSLYLRAFALGTVAARSPWLASAAIIGAAATSRVACLLPLLLLPPARQDGLGAGAGRPTGASLAVGLMVAIGFSLLATLFGASVLRVVLAVALSLAGALAVCGLAWRQIGGQTGDVAGAAQQVSEIAMLLVLAAAARGA